MNSITVGTKYEKIEDKHHGTSLKLVKSHSSISWNKNPVLISEEQKAAMNFSYVIKIIKGEVKSPSEMAGLDHQDLDPVIDQMNKIFQDAILSYGKKLENASILDNMNIKQLNKECYSFWPGVASATAAGGSVGAGVGTAIVPGIGTVAGAIIGGLGSFFAAFLIGKQIRRNSILQRGSANRIMWMKDIDSLEKVRLIQLEIDLNFRANELMNILQKTLLDNEIDLPTAKYLKQVYWVKSSLFPQDKVMNEKILKCLHMLEKDFPVIKAIKKKEKI